MTLWLASFPRSGNTLLRQVLHAGWGLQSGSVYSLDLGDNLAVIRACGHVDLRVLSDGRGRCLLNPHNIPIKTHQLPQNQTDRAIYVLRDGRAACVSLWHFLAQGVSLEDVVCGRTQFGTWSDHVMAWTAQPGIAALIRYEEMINAPEAAVTALSGLFGAPPCDPLEPLRNRDAIAAQDGTWVRRPSDWRAHWSDACEELFVRHNRPAMEQFYGAAAALQPDMRDAEMPPLAMRA